MLAVIARAVSIATIVSTAAAAETGDDARVRNVVELFTSQGCSSCPPADRVLAQLARDPATLAISFPVDYWDYIGWKDTLAAPLFTARQQAYASADGKRQVYTPQAVINGLAEVVGSDLDAIKRAERDTGKNGGVLSAPLSVTRHGDAIDIAIGATPEHMDRGASVYLVAIASSRTVAVKRGENAGATLTYANVVRAMTKIGEWSGERAEFHVDFAQARIDGADASAVIVQTGGRTDPSAILAAARGP